MPNQFTTEEGKRERALYMQEWSKKHPGRACAYVRRAYWKVKDQLLDLLGRKCAKCGFEDERALQFDHIEGGGNQERRNHMNGCSGYGPSLLRKWLADPEIKLKLQILCANCNWIKRAEKKEHLIGNERRTGRRRKYLN